AGRLVAAAEPASDFGARTLLPAEPLLTHRGHTLLCAGDSGLVYGKAGIGKTALALGLVFALSLGESYLGFGTPKGGVPVGLLELELPDDALQARLRGIAGERLADLRNLSIVCRPALKGLVDLDTPADRAAMREWVVSKGLKLVVVDALVRAHGSGE